MITIPVVKTWPNDAIVESIQGKITKVYPPRVIASGKTVQNAEFYDAGNNNVRLVVWEHPDLTPLIGKEIVLHSSSGGNGKLNGVKVVHGSYVAQKDGRNHKAGDTIPTFELSVSKAGHFQLIEVYNAQNPDKKPEPKAGDRVPTEPTKPAQSEKKVVYGGTVGMAINQACASLIANGLDLEEERVWKIASGLVRVAIKMEAGDLAEKSEAEKPENIPF